MKKINKSDGQMPGQKTNPEFNKQSKRNTNTAKKRGNLNSSKNREIDLLWM